MLVREWDGQLHRVMVLADGFAWNDKIYPSLSKVAFAMTGTRWNGPRFFGLRDKPSKEASTMKNGAAKPVRCAIYTRVSTDQGLEQDFNSLDAQRDASQAYIRSQAHAGWTLIRAQLQRRRLFWRLDRSAGPATPAGGCEGRKDRRHCRLQGRPPDPLAG